MRLSKDADIQAIAEEAENMAWNEVEQGLGPEIQQSVQVLHSAAADYMRVVNDLSFQIQVFRDTLKRQKELRKTVKDYESAEEYLQNKEQIAEFLHVSQIPEKLYSESFKFQNILNEVLGQKIVMTFVYAGKNGPELYEMLSEKVLKFDYSKNNQLTARYNIAQNQLKDLARNMELDNDLKFSLPGLKSTYQEVMHRYEIARDRKTYMVMWDKGDYWEKLKVSSAGDINEAYAKFILENQADPSFTLGMEENIEDYMLQGVALVDNISGLLQGDVTIGNIEYGVKSAGASVLGLTQITKLAQKILKDATFDVNKLREEKERLRKRGKQRNTKATDMVNDAIDEIIAILQAEKK